MQTGPRRGRAALTASGAARATTALHSAITCSPRLSPPIAQNAFLIVTLAFRNQRKPLKTQADHEF